MAQVRRVGCAGTKRSEPVVLRPWSLDWGGAGPYVSRESVKSPIPFDRIPSQRPPPRRRRSPNHPRASLHVHHAPIDTRLTPARFLGAHNEKPGNQTGPPLDAVLLVAGLGARVLHVPLDLHRGPPARDRPAERD